MNKTIIPGFGQETELLPPPALSLPLFDFSNTTEIISPTTFFPSPLSTHPPPPTSVLLPEQASPHRHVLTTNITVPSMPEPSRNPALLTLLFNHHQEQIQLMQQASWPIHPSFPSMHSASIPGLSVQNPLPSVLHAHAHAFHQQPHRLTAPTTMNNNNNNNNNNKRPVFRSPQSRQSTVVVADDTIDDDVIKPVGTCTFPPPRRTTSTKKTTAATTTNNKTTNNKGNKDDDDNHGKYIGISKHKRSGRYEAHIWSGPLQKQLYLGGYTHAHEAAEAYDILALKIKGHATPLNFPIDQYQHLLDAIAATEIIELIMAVRRRSHSFSRGSSTFRGVSKHFNGRYEARVGIPNGMHVYLGVTDTEAEAAKVYDAALVRLRGANAATNMPLGGYSVEMEEYGRMQERVKRNDRVFQEMRGRAVLYEAWLKGGEAGLKEGMVELGMTWEWDAVVAKNGGGRHRETTKTKTTMKKKKKRVESDYDDESEEEAELCGDDDDSGVDGEEIFLQRGSKRRKAGEGR